MTRCSVLLLALALLAAPGPVFAADVPILLETGTLRPEAGAHGRPMRASGPELWMVQLVRAPEAEWLDELRAAGAHLLSYVPHLTYLVWAEPRSLLARSAHLDFIRWQGPYRPRWRLHPALHPVAARGGRTAQVTVLVAAVPEADATLRALEALARDGVHAVRVLELLHLRLSVASERLFEAAELPAVLWVEPRFAPERLGEVQAQIVAGNVSGGQPTGPGYLAFLAGRGLGAGQFGSFVVEIVDDSLHPGTHPDLPEPRIAFRQNPSLQAPGESGHGYLIAHVAGGHNDRAGAAFEDAQGYNYGLGTAPFARIGFTAVFGPAVVSPSDWEPAAYEMGARISSNSWGFSNVNDYDATAREVDALVRDAQPQSAGNQQLVMVFAAGNEGARGPGSVSSPGTAKNVLTVGASESVRSLPASDNCGNGPQHSDDARDVLPSSGRGPVAGLASVDGRFKPELVAPGSKIISGVPQTSYGPEEICLRHYPPGQTLYGLLSGTSPATPAVSGAAALLRQDFLNRGRPAPSPAMTKAYLTNAAAYQSGTLANDTLPSSTQGLGRTDLGRALDTAPRMLLDQTRLLTPAEAAFTWEGVVADAVRPLRVSLAWTDAPGFPGSAPWVNDLDLEVTAGGVLYRGNVFSGATSVPGGTADRRNNLESVFLAAGVTGALSVRVRAASLMGDGVPGNGLALDQDFALVVYNARPVVTGGEVPAGPGAALALLTCALAVAARAWRIRRHAPAGR
jgi:hypothetical protein